jgi:hypothetical protein
VAHVDLPPPPLLPTGFVPERVVLEEPVVLDISNAALQVYGIVNIALH